MGSKLAHSAANCTSQITPTTACQSSCQRTLSIAGFQQLQLREYQRNWLIASEGTECALATLFTVEEETLDDAHTLGGDKMNGFAAPAACAFVLTPRLLRLASFTRRSDHPQQQDS
jgi:hypothetical protein